MKFVKYLALTLMVTLMATSGAYAADSVNESAQFTIGNAYEIDVYNSTVLEFPGDSEVGNVDSTGQFETTTLEVYLQHNYNVQVTGSATGFQLDNETSDYSSAYVIPAEWHFAWAEGTYPEGEGNWNTENPLTIGTTGTVEASLDAELDSTEGDAFGSISVKADRSGLDDPQGTYEATLDITVSDLS